VKGKLHLGVNGYYLQQITDSNFNGTPIPDSKERVVAIGPGALDVFSSRDLLFLNAYYEGRSTESLRGSEAQPTLDP
jgi:hypothetical protein